MSFLSKLGLAVAGPLVGGLLGKSSAKSQANTEAQLSRENWEYQQSNAHQLEVQDLRNAGLNPILSATQSQMAGMAPVHASDPANFSGNISSALQGFFEREAKMEMQSKDLEIEQLRADIEKTRAETDKYRAEQEASLWKSQENLNSARVTNETQESQARVKQVLSDIANNKLITDATVKQLASGTALNYQQIEGVKSQMLKAVSEARLSDEQRHALELEINSGTRALKNKSASYQSEFLDTWYGKLLHQFGFSLQLANPFSGFSAREGNAAVSVRK